MTEQYTEQLLRERALELGSYIKQISGGFPVTMASASIEVTYDDGGVIVADLVRNAYGEEPGPPAPPPPAPEPPPPPVLSRRQARAMRFALAYANATGRMVGWLSIAVTRFGALICILLSGGEEGVI